MPPCTRPSIAVVPLLDPSSAPADEKGGSNFCLSMCLNKEEKEKKDPLVITIPPAFAPLVYLLVWLLASASPCFPPKSNPFHSHNRKVHTFLLFSYSYLSIARAIPRIFTLACFFSSFLCGNILRYGGVLGGRAESNRITEKNRTETSNDRSKQAKRSSQFRPNVFLG